MYIHMHIPTTSHYVFLYFLYWSCYFFSLTFRFIPRYTLLCVLIKQNWFQLVAGYQFNIFYYISSELQIHNHNKHTCATQSIFRTYRLQNWRYVWWVLNCTWIEVSEAGNQAVSLIIPNEWNENEKIIINPKPKPRMCMKRREMKYYWLEGRTPMLSHSSSVMAGSW